MSDTNEAARRVAVVTGGSRGIGRAIALRLAADGCDVAVVYAGNEAAAAETVAAIEALGVRAGAWRCDVSSAEETAAVCKQIGEELGSVTVLVNNAGIVRDKLLGRLSEEDFDRVIDVNLKGAFNMTKALYRTWLRNKGDGRIVNVSSVVGLMGNAGQVNYAASKAGLIGLTKSVARELAPRGVTCNAVAPGFIETEMTGALTDEVRAQYDASIPLGRMGSPEDVASVVSFLASPAAGYVTGEVVRVDGGLAM
jgi:3-oxoacyl-[acyl-carrier protein] reductase